MSTETPFTPPRKKPNVLWWVGGVLVLLLGLFFYQLFGPSPRIVVSPQTTYITEPLRADGLPDYERYVLELYRDGVTPENNAAVLLWQALGPEELYAIVAAELGLSEIPSEHESLVPLYAQVNRAQVREWLREQAKDREEESPTEASAEDSLDDADAFEPTFGGPDFFGGIDPYDDLAEQLLDQAMSRPWTSDEFPPLAGWVAANEEPLALVVEASRRPRYYSPSPTLLDGERVGIFAMLLPGVQGTREAARALSARAMWHLGEGRTEEAWQDLLAVHRLARLVGQGGFLVEQLVAMRIDGIASAGTRALLHHGELTPDEAGRIARDLAELSPFSVAECYDQTERLGYLDAIIDLAAGGETEMWSFFGVGYGYMNVVAIDWNIALGKGNRFFDRMSAAARLPTRVQRQQAFAEIEADINQLATPIQGPGTVFGALVNPAHRSDVVANMLLGLFLPAISAASHAEDRANTMLGLTRLAAALAVYRAEQGEYPAALDDLMPGVVDALQVDVYNAQPFIYKRTDDGYLLYSAGENGIDDGGSHAQWNIIEGRSRDELGAAEFEKREARIPAGADDISIRVPRPAFKLPALPPLGE